MESCMPKVVQTIDQQPQGIQVHLGVEVLLGQAL
jgi:hypothetical protein